MKPKSTRQYTLRRVPPRVDQALREKSLREKRSLNEVAIEALTVGVGSANQPVVFDDLDHWVGSWKEDPEFDKVIRAQDRIDRDLWK